MTNIEWTLSICLFIWILSLAGEIPLGIGCGAIIMILVLCYLVENDFFGGGRR